MPRRALRVLILLLVRSGAAHAQQPPPLDGPTRVFQDSRLERLTGTWTVTGTAHGRPVSYHAQAAWVLGHQFLRFDMRDTAEPPAYEASVYIGYDHASERYVAHWLDTFGGRSSETLGFGTPDGQAIRFVFEYPDGPFQTTFTSDPDRGGWTILMRERGAGGAWEDFGRFDLRRS